MLIEAAVGGTIFMAGLLICITRKQAPGSENKMDGRNAYIARYGNKRLVNGVWYA
jgi:hypothetical protein